jgi:hypothetical protein
VAWPPEPLLPLGAEPDVPAAEVPAVLEEDPEVPALPLTAAEPAPVVGVVLMPDVPEPAVARASFAGALSSPQPEFIVAIQKIANPRVCALFIASPLPRCLVVAC